MDQFGHGRMPFSGPNATSNQSNPTMQMQNAHFHQFNIQTSQMNSPAFQMRPSAHDPYHQFPGQPYLNRVIQPGNPQAYPQATANQFMQGPNNYGVSSNISTQQSKSKGGLVNVSSSADRKKFEQQQKLKAFSKVGVRPSIDADAFMKNMIGITPAEKKIVKAKPKSNITDDSFGDFVQCQEEVKPRTNSAPVISNTSVPTDLGHVVQSNNLPSADIKPPAPKQDINEMMAKCSDLQMPKKASTFKQKVSVKEIVPTKTSSKVFAVSQKAVDWSKVSSDFEESFQMPSAAPPVPVDEFPSWCTEEHVPEVYKQIEQAVKNEQDMIQTASLYSLLITSGLPQPLLAHIWGIANKTTPGQLTQQELYVLLALVATAQGGHSFMNAEILHNYPQAPIPNFQFMHQQQVPISQPIADQSHTSSIQPPSQPVASVPNINAAPLTEPILSHQITNPANDAVNQVQSSNFEVSNVPKMVSGNYKRAAVLNEPPSQNVAVEQGVSLLNLTKNTNQSSNIVTQSSSDHTNEEDFDDFVSAAVTDKTLPVTNEDDFDDFQMASHPQIPTSTSSASTFNPPKVVSAKQTPNPSDLMNIEHEDRYSAFRELSFAEPAAPEPVLNANTDLTTNSEICFEADFSNFESKATDDDDENFGDFAFCSENSGNSLNVDLNKKIESLSIGDNQSNSSFDLANSDSSSRKQALFTDSQSVASLELDPIFFQKKDNAFGGENLSVASLEFGNFTSETGGQSNHSKSPISKSESTPSLDFKISSPETDDDFGEMVSASADAQPVDASVPLQINPNDGLFVDKYSSVRIEDQLNESNDLHVNEWLKCLKSCSDILSKANSIFNDISSSEVCNEVLSTEEGSSYYKNVIEVYRVTQRLSLSIESFKKNDEKINALLGDIQQTWNALTTFIIGISITPDENSFDYSSGVFQYPTQEDLQNACGVCLLNVNCRSKAFNREEDSYKLSYGGRQYHSSCANLWVNCVNSLLPALPLPQLL